MPVSNVVKVEVEIAVIQAATQLVMTGTGKLAPDMAKRYKMFYKAIVEAYNEAHPLP